MDWDPNELVTWHGARLISRPDLEVRQIKGIETPQRVGRGEFSVEANGDERRISIGSHYWDAAVTQFAEIKGDIVDVTVLPYNWVVGERKGTKFYFYKIQETNQE